MDRSYSHRLLQLVSAATMPVLLLGSVGMFVLWGTLPARAEPSYPVINEVQVTGGSGKTTADFVELFNPTSAPYDLKEHRLVKRTATGSSDTTLKSWTSSAVIPAYGFYLWANSGFSSIAAAPDAATSESITDNNGLALRRGAADTGEIIDAVAWGSAQNAFVGTAAFPQNPGASQSIERKVLVRGSRQDTGDTSQDFMLQVSPAPQGTTSAQETPDAGAAPPRVNVGDVVVNELVSDPVDGGEEWVELLNRSNRPIDLASWTLEEGSHSVTQLSGTLAESGTGRFLVVRSPKGNLNNDGDVVLLRYGDTVVDQVAYGSWDDGSKGDNAPAAVDPKALGRLPDGTKTGNDSLDFALVSPTPGQSNQALTQTAESGAGKAATPAGGIAFNELYPNPPLGDAGEFIELVNLSAASLNLTGWVLADEVSSYTLAATPASSSLAPGKLLLLPRSITGLALDNEGTEHLTLTSPDGRAALKFSYTGPAEEGAGYARNELGKWSWTTKPTPGQPNVLAAPNQPPHLALSGPKRGSPGQPLVFDASDSVDPEGGALTFSWSFGDSAVSQEATPTHAYSRSGKFTVRLTATDPVGANAADTQSVTIDPGLEPTVLGVGTGTLELSEFLPNPEGSDSGEWIELANAGTEIADTANWRLAIGSRTSNLPIRKVLPNSYLVLQKSEVGFTLTNGGGSIELRAPDGSVRSSVSYGEAAEGAAYARIGSTWKWTNLPTPGGANVLADAAADSDEFETTPLSEIRTQESGTKVRVTGTVTAVPKTLGERTFYVGTPGLEVRLSSGEVPKLQLGDQVQLDGTISRSATGTRLLVRKPTSLTFLRHDSLPAAAELTVSDVSEELEGSLVSVSGRTTHSAKTSFTLVDGDASLTVSLRNRSAAWPKLQLGQTVSVTGIVGLAGGQVRLLPRTPEDVTLGEITAKPAAPVDLTQKAAESSQGYLLVGLVGLLVAASYLWERAGWPKPAELVSRLRRRS